MRLVLNLLWLVLSGFWMFLAYMVVGALWSITIIGIPFGIASLRIGLLAPWPFGRTIVAKPGAGVGSGVGNVFWFILSGIWLAIGHAVSGVLLCVTIIGIPLGLANFKLIPISLFPLGKDIVPTGAVNAAVASGVVVGPRADHGRQATGEGAPLPALASDIAGGARRARRTEFRRGRCCALSLSDQSPA